VKTDILKLDFRLNFNQKNKNAQKIRTNSQIIGLFLF